VIESLKQLLETLAFELQDDGSHLILPVRIVLHCLIAALIIAMLVFGFGWIARRPAIDRQMITILGRHMAGGGIRTIDDLSQGPHFSFTHAAKGNRHE
jgi:hypothetical protein